MKITYWKHSGFSIDYSRGAILIDYIGGGFVKRGEVTALISHSHGDHKSPLAYEIADNAIDKMSAGDETEINGVHIRAFGSTDEGVSFMLDVDGRRIFHAGDLNLWSWKDESTEEEISQARADYFAVLDSMSEYANTIDLAMFPVDARMGTDYAEGAEIFIERMRPKIFVPMHFWNRDDTAVDFAKNHPCARALTRAGEFIEI